MHQLAGGDDGSASHLYEGVVAFTVEAIRAIVGREWSPSQITFPHRPRADARTYEDHFGAPVRCGVGMQSVVELDASFLASPNIRRAHPTTGAALARATPVSDAVDRGDGADEAFAATLERIVDGMMMVGAVSLPAAARTLGYAPRTLQRRILKTGKSFERIVDDRRRARASEFLADPTHSIAEAAMAVGYSDSAHFIRAFQRWTGKSPAAYRKAVRSERTDLRFGV